MKRLLGLALWVEPWLALANQGGHESHGEPHLNWWTWDMHAPPMGWFLLDFAIFVFLLVKFTRGPLRRAFENRHASIKKTLAENASALAKADASFTEARDKLAAVEHDVQSLIARLKEDGAVERQRIIDNARVYAERLRKDSESLLVQEAQAARARAQQGRPRSLGRSSDRRARTFRWRQCRPEAALAAHGWR